MGSTEVQPTARDLVEAARQAAVRCDWDTAHDALRRADALLPLDDADLVLFAEVAYAAGDLDATIEAWERLHTDRADAGDAPGAGEAATRIAMHLMMDTGLMAPVRAWIRRAERLLADQEETPVHAWLAVATTYERLFSGDFAASLEQARRAAEIGFRQHAPAPHAMGRVAEARGVILAGDVHRGLELLDEAALVALSGEVDPLTVGLLYCELVCAWQALAQYDRAEEWTRAMERWCRGHSMGSVRGRCRVHRAEILRLRGSCAEAEDEAMAACEELRPILRREFGWPLTELGSIRLQKGDLDGAEAAFLEAYEAGWEPQPGYALLLLARGDAPGALASIDDALDRPMDIPSKELPPRTELRRAALLGTAAEIRLALGDLEGAHAAAEELAGIATTFDSDGLRAAAAAAIGAVLLEEGQLADAQAASERAVGWWIRLAAPYETGRARLQLGETLRRQGNEHHAVREFQAARSAFERIGAWRGAAEAAEACGEPNAGFEAAPERSVAAPSDAGAGAASPSSPPATNVFVREGDHWCLGFDGITIRLRDLRGLQYLARLLAEPGREFLAADLVSLEADPEARGGPKTTQELVADGRGDAGEVLDATAKAAYRRRLLEVDDDIEEARRFGDDERFHLATVDREFLVRELSKAVGLGGRDRRSASPTERARASVTRAIRHAMKRIAEHHEPLGTHLERTVRTGTYCVYLPDDRVPARWRV